MIVCISTFSHSAVVITSALSKASPDAQQPTFSTASRLYKATPPDLKLPTLSAALFTCLDRLLIRESAMRL
ncbi:hypothetical protein QC762_0004120 [Podospora pseudocomata]|uniref:Uncharacterized protein n=1 Tax=Podospora pseudocomata TaxID=2093779 RepID=A0ABR0GT92_9PEZI|nr:hypothetical protein QC762_0004120 [Podospora pseudocomata]